MKVLLVDDHKIIREGLIKILLSQFPSAVFEESANAEEAFQKINNSDYDLLICDLTMPGRSGLDIIKQLRETHPRLPVIVLSMHPEEHYALRALKAGASAYLNKTDSAETLIAAIQRVLQGRKYIPAVLAEQLADNLTNTEVQPHESLSDREFYVFRLIAEGKSISDISSALSLSPSTVSTHRARILKKFRMKTNADLTKYALHHNLI